MAITRDNSRDPQAYSGTFSYTTAGNDRLLLVGAYTGDGSSPAVTYNGVSMTIVSSVIYNGTGRASLYALLNPASGANTVSCGSPIAYCGVSSYNGVDTGQTIPDAAAENHANASSWTATLTAVGSDVAVMGFFVYDGGGTGSAGTDTTVLNAWVGAVGMFMAESSSLSLGSGSRSLQITATSGANAGLVIASFKAVAPTSAIKTINGLAKASVKTVNGLAIASVKTFNGLA